MYYAHSTSDPSQRDWQPLADHLLGVAKLAEQFGTKIGIERASYLAGLLHDLGKYTAGFQARLAGGPRVDHATAGAAEVCSPAQRARYGQMADLVAYVIAGHHTGLPDGTGIASLADRLEAAQELETLDPVWRDEITLPEGKIALPPIKPNQKRGGFQIAFLGRMLFSCLVDADFRDTEAFCAKVEGRAIDRNWPRLGDIIGGLVDRFDTYMAERQRLAPDRPINHVRREILAHVRGKAELPPGIFTLTVPTGGGKTLASLAFALDHAKRHKLCRIIYAIPFTSIIEQTAGIFRDVLGTDVVLEHHSAIEDTNTDMREARDKLRFAMDDWAAPIVVTTNVQLFESLFSNRSSRCRKLHNLAHSVIVLDEAQAIPLILFKPVVAVLGELARNYGVSIVLCTATQPALDAPPFADDLVLDPTRELAPDPGGLAAKLGRVTIRRTGAMADETLTAAMGEAEQCLTIVNSRAHALGLFRQAALAEYSGVIHLTTRQYAAHRSRILADIRKRLVENQPCRVIATSLVEAGVDLDFPRVFRAEAGLDQITQAAGRCNREGKRAHEDSIVTVFSTPDNPPPAEIAQMAAAFGRMADKFPDWQSPDAIRAYFEEVYWSKGPALDKHGILDMFMLAPGGVDFKYRTVAEAFRMIETGLVPVIVPFEAEAQAAVKRLAVPDISTGGIARDLQRYIVQVPPKARQKLIDAGHVVYAQRDRLGHQFAVLVTNSLYGPDTGLLWEDAEYLGQEMWIL